MTRKGLTQNARIFKQAKSLTDAGAEVVLLGVRLGEAPPRERRDGYEIVRLEVRAARPPAEAPGRLAALGRFLRPLTFLLVTWQLLRESVAEVARRPPPTVVHANDLDALHAALVIARRHRVPVVYDAQELYPGIHAYPGWFQTLLRHYERLVIKGATRVIAVNPMIARQMERDYRRPVDAVVLNCAPLAPDVETGDGLRHRLGLPPDQPVYLYSGGLTPQRGIENLVRALHHLPSGVLVILGEGELEPVLREQVEREGLGDRVVFAPYVPYDEVPAFIAGADVGVLPYEDVGLNHRLASPSKLFHYIQAELPIACSDFPFLRSIVCEHAVGATFDPARPESIADALERVVGDREAHLAMKSRLRELKRRYSWEEEEERFLAVYRSLDVA